MVDGRWWEWERASGKDVAMTELFVCLCWYFILFFVLLNMVVRCLFFGIFFFEFGFFFFLTLC